MLWFLLGCFITKTPPNSEHGDSVSPDSVVEQLVIDDCQNKVGYSACNMGGVNSLGDIEELYDFYGSPIVLDLSAMWCGPCNLAGSEVQEISDLYAAEDLVYLTVLIEDRARQIPDEEDIQWWLEHWGITTAPVIGSSRELINNTDPTAGWFLEGWPTFYLIDEEMKIESYFRGYSRETLDLHIRNLLEN